MALRADVQYVQYRVEGTAARRVEKPVTEVHTAPVYRRRKAETKVIAVDPVALAGIFLSAVVLIAMVVGLVQYRQGIERRTQMSTYVQKLEKENANLEQVYKEGYDPDEIMDIALKAGMVPEESVNKVSVQMQQPQQEQTKMSLWEAVTTFLTGIFA